MSRFFAAKSKKDKKDKKDKNLHDNSDDSEDDDSDLSLSSDSDSDSDSGMKSRDTKQPAAKNEFAMFRRGDEDDSEDDSEEDDDSQDESDEEAKAVAVKRGTFARAAYSDDSDESDDEDVKRTVKSARDKRFEEMRAIVKILNNAKKINDWVAIQNGSFPATPPLSSKRFLFLLSFYPFRIFSLARNLK
jgi:hypothetical protein